MSQVWFNPDSKERYISIREKSNSMFRTNATILFNKVAEYEEKYGKDVSTWTFSEINIFYKNLYSRSIHYITRVHEYLTNYSKFMQNENTLSDGINHYDEITNKVLASCVNVGLKNSKVVTKEELYYTLDNICEFRNPCEYYGILAPYEGLRTFTYEDMAKITTDCIYDTYVILPISGVKLEISERLRNYMIDSINSTEWELNSEKMSRKFPFINNDYVLKAFNTDSDQDYLDSHTYCTRLSNNQIKLGLSWIGIKSLELSGMLNEIKEISQEKHMEWQEVIYDKECLERISYRYRNAKTKLKLKRAFIESYDWFFKGV